MLSTGITRLDSFTLSLTLMEEYHAFFAKANFVWVMTVHLSFSLVDCRTICHARSYVAFNQRRVAIFE